jgi:hypothetical protein
MSQKFHAGDYLCSHTKNRNIRFILRGSETFTNRVSIKPRKSGANQEQAARWITDAQSVTENRTKR